MSKDIKGHIMGVKTEVAMYNKYVAKCKKAKIKPIDFIEFIITIEGQ